MVRSAFLKKIVILENEQGIAALLLSYRLFYFFDVFPSFHQVRFFILSDSSLI